MEYRFEEVQNLQFAVYDVDDKHHVDHTDKQQLIGSMECTLGDVIAAGEHLTKSLRLKGDMNVRVCWICYMCYLLACLLMH